MTAADAFTRATPPYRHASRLGAEPLPLVAGEVLELPRPVRWGRRLVGLTAFALVVAVLLAVRAA